MLLERYLTAIGVGRDRPSVELLQRVLRGHLARFPYETLGMGLGQDYPLDVDSCLARALEGRPGYCYTQNTLFAAALEELGFEVFRHLGVVTGRTKPEPTCITGGHMAVTVRIDDATWFADAGLGPGPVLVAPLRVGPFTQGNFTHHFEDSPVPRGAWRLTPDPRLGTFRAMDFAEAPVPQDAFAPLHEERRRIGTPGCPYFVVQRPSMKGVTMIAGVAQSGPGLESRALVDLEEWKQAVGRLGCRALDHSPATEVARLHARLVREHQAYSEASGSEPGAAVRRSASVRRS